MFKKLFGIKEDINPITILTPGGNVLQVRDTITPDQATDLVKLQEIAMRHDTNIQAIKGAVAATVPNVDAMAGAVLASLRQQQSTNRDRLLEIANRSPVSEAIHSITSGAFRRKTTTVNEIGTDNLLAVGQIDKTTGQLQLANHFGQLAIAKSEMSKRLGIQQDSSRLKHTKVVDENFASGVNLFAQNNTPFNMSEFAQAHAFSAAAVSFDNNGYADTSPDGHASVSGAGIAISSYTQVSAQSHFSGHIGGNFKVES